MRLNLRVFQFRCRSLLLLTVVLAVLLAWVGTKMKRYALERSVAQELAPLGARVWGDGGGDGAFSWIYRAAPFLDEMKYLDAEITDAGIVNLSNLTRLRMLALDGCQITDTGMKALPHVPELEWLTTTSFQLYRTA